MAFEYDPTSAPTVVAYDIGNGEAVMWCDYCGRYHFHGNNSGHRGAHCTGFPTTVSPYRATGYNLDVRPASATVLDAVREQLHPPKRMRRSYK